jgi:hypothetical protein
VQQLYAVKMVRKPASWSHVDVDQFTIEVRAHEDLTKKASTARPG